MWTINNQLILFEDYHILNYTFRYSYNLFNYINNSKFTHNKAEKASIEI